MPHATFRFYAELNDFLPPHLRQIDFAHEWQGQVSIKHLIESLGVPHTEVDLILVNAESVDFSHQPQDGDQISVYPVFETFDIAPAVRLRPLPLREPRFVVDGHLGRLAAYLRLLGFDVAWRSNADDAELADRSQQDKRILLTRDRGLLKRRSVSHGYWIRSTVPREQACEVIERFDLYRRAAPFTRCLSCNGILKPVPIEEVFDRLRPNTLAHYHDFWQCDQCAKVYWQGSHYRRMTKLLQDILNGAMRGAAKNCRMTSGL